MQTKQCMNSFIERTNVLYDECYLPENGALTK